jgi:antitoxin component YwqK of YwqJK toxin-antitoxin module
MKIICPFYLLIAVTLFACTKKFDGRNGVREEFYPSTNVLKKSIEYKDGKMTGAYFEYYPNGKIKTEATLANNKYNGLVKKFYDTGALRLEESYVNAKRNGWSKMYRKDGKLQTEILYNDDKYNGPFNTYFPDGKPHKLFNFLFGEKHGEMKVFYENGQLKYVSYYKNDSPGLGLKEYEEDGKEINNNFEIICIEKNTLYIDGKYCYLFKFSPNDEKDELFEVRLNENKYLSLKGDYYRLSRKGDTFRRCLYTERGKANFYDIHLVGVKKTAFGNDFLEMKTVHVSISPNL